MAIFFSWYIQKNMLHNIMHVENSETRSLSVCRTELNTSSSRRTALELFDYFCVFFIKSSVRFDRTEL